MNPYTWGEAVALAAELDNHGYHGTSGKILAFDRITDAQRMATIVRLRKLRGIASTDVLKNTLFVLASRFLDWADHGFPSEVSQ